MPPARHIGSTLLNSNRLSGYLLPYIPVLISFKYGKKLDQRYYWGILATVISTALVLTYCRGGWYACIIALVVMALLYDKKLLGFVLIYCLVYSFAYTGVWDRAMSGMEPADDRTSLQRIQLWQVGLRMWQDAPLTGVGIGNYIPLHDTYLGKYPELDRGCEAINPHNSIIKALAETGIVGAGLLLSLLLVLARELWKVVYKVLREPRIALIMGAACGMLAFLLQSNTNCLLYFPRNAFGFWVVAGLGIQLAQKSSLARG